MHADKKITVNVASGGTAVFPEADCTRPIFYGPAFADTTGGNRRGSCEPPKPGQIWSEFSPHPEIPRELNNWAQSGPEAAAPEQICPASLNQGTQLANCFSFLCDSETFINGVPVATSLSARRVADRPAGCSADNVYNAGRSG